MIFLFFMNKIKIKPSGLRKDQRHFRWNWEKSPDNFHMNDPMARYHFLFVDDSNFDIKKGLDRVLSQISALHPGVIPIREVKGNVNNSGMKYTLATYDTVISPISINFGDVGLPYNKDEQLKERKVLSIIDYVERLYGPSEINQ